MPHQSRWFALRDRREYVLGLIEPLTRENNLLTAPEVYTLIDTVGTLEEVLRTCNDWCTPPSSGFDDDEALQAYASASTSAYKAAKEKLHTAREDAMLLLVAEQR